MAAAIPIGIKKKMGRTAHRKMPEDITPPEGMPKPPIYLDDYALEEWYRLADGLHNMGVLSVVDQGAFAACCEAYSDWRHASEEINKVKNEQSVLESMIHITHNGNQIQHALIGVKNAAREKYIDACKQFGMTPMARTKMAMTGMRAGEGSKFKGLIGQKVINAF